MPHAVAARALYLANDFVLTFWWSSSCFVDGQMLVVDGRAQSKMFAQKCYAGGAASNAATRPCDAISCKTAFSHMGTPAIQGIMTSSTHGGCRMHNR